MSINANALHHWRVVRTAELAVEVRHWSTTPDDEVVVQEWRWNERHGWHETVRLFDYDVPSEIVAWRKRLTAVWD